jgi:glycosyltransferase involved in cell wall biosynthesis
VAARLASKGIEADVLPNIAPWPLSPRRGLAERDGIAFVGRLTPEKGLSDVISLAGLLPSVTVRIAGDGEHREDVERAARQLPNLEYVGRLPRSKIPGFLASARVAVVPSAWQEPGALVTLEAMSAGTPLAVYAVGGIEEYVRTSGAGLVVAPDTRQLADACGELLHDARHWQACSDAGIASAAGAFSSDSHCHRLEAIFDRVVRA